MVIIMNKIEFISNANLTLSAVQLLEMDYPEMISEKYSYDFSIRINGNTFFDCGDNSFTLIEFLQAVVRWAYRKEDLLYYSIETDDNPLISFVREDDGLYSIHSPWQLFKCNEHFSFEQLISVLDLVNVELKDNGNMSGKDN